MCSTVAGLVDALGAATKVQRNANYEPIGRIDRIDPGAAHGVMPI